MAASRIQGITVEIGGDTTKLTDALKGVNGEIHTTQSQLRDVERLLKLDPGNTELLAQKHRLLARKKKSRQRLCPPITSWFLKNRDFGKCGDYTADTLPDKCVRGREGHPGK